MVGTGGPATMTLRVVVVGLGGRGRDWVRAVRAHPRFELAGCVEVDPRVLGEAANTLGLPRDACFPHLDEALGRTRADAVIVATSIRHHVAPVRTAFGHRLGVLVEKPFTLSVEEAVQLVRQAEEARTPLVVGQNSRFLRVHRTVKRVLASGRLGPLGLVVTQYYRPFEDMSASLASLADHLLWEAAVHHLDALRFVIAREAAAVMAHSFALPWASGAPGSSLEALIEFEGGIRAVYCGAYHTRGHEFFEGGREFYQRFVGERGTMHVFHRWILVCERGRLPRAVWRGRRPYTEERLLLDEMDGALTRGVEPSSSGRDNVNTVALLEACAISSAERRWVRPRDLLDAAS
jgi:predicted dehydrogenase